MKILKLSQACTVQSLGEFNNWESSTIFEPVYVVAEHIESLSSTGYTNLNMVSGEIIKVSEGIDVVLNQLKAPEAK